MSDFAIMIYKQLYDTLYRVWKFNDTIIVS